MGKSEKLVVLGVLFFVVLLFVWSLQSDGSPSQQRGEGVQAAERDPVIAPRMNERAPRDGKAGKGAHPNQDEGPARPGGGERSPDSSAVADSDVARRGGSVSTRMLLAETSVSGRSGSDLGGADPATGVEVTSGSSRRQRAGASSLADPAARSGAGGATSRSNAIGSGISRARVRMQPGWDLITTAGLQGTVDPSMFIYEVSAETSAEDATWGTIAKDLYGDAAKANLLRHSNESMDVPRGPIFVPAKDELGKDASVRTVEVLQGESLWQVAKRTLGKGSEWKAVWEANRDVIPDPDIVAAGTVLRIPIL